MKTSFKTIKNAISKFYDDVEIKKYYVEDESQVCQKIVICGVLFTNINNELVRRFFVISIIGNRNRTPLDIVKEIQIFENRYESLYMFSQYIY